MTRLTPTLFDRRYDQLLELGRSLLPRLAPDWTDYNAHDPGITLMELLAWVTEAQLYSVGHTRRDERLAYASLLGVAPHGTRPACGLIWPDRTDTSSTATTYAGSRVIAADAVVRLDGVDEPVFHPDRRILWVPGRVVRLSSRLADGSARDLTRSNDRGAAFLPFGERAGPHDVLAVYFETRGEEGLFPVRRVDAAGAFWVIGVRVADDSAIRDEDQAESLPEGGLSVSLVTDTTRDSLPVVEDTTTGLLRTGALVLDVSRVTGSPPNFEIEIRSPVGFARPPRFLRIEPNVLPITQRRSIERELHDGSERPDFSFDLAVPGLCFEPQQHGIRVEVSVGGEFHEWQRCDQLSETGPHARSYELDEDRGRLLFGNGVNGYKPSPEARVYVSYSVSNGADGNVARNRKWTVAGFTGLFGTNPDPVAGGAARADSIELRREGRRRLKQDHALVSAEDIALAALALPLLDVARAWVVAPSSKAPQTGTVTLVAMRARPGDTEPLQPPETARWLEAVRRRLRARMPLGTRLVVAAPRYADFFVRAELEVAGTRNPDDVVQVVRETLTRKLALVKSPATKQLRDPGVPVTRSDVAAWVLGVPGVGRVASLELVEGRKVTKKIAVPRGGLPRLDLEQSPIHVTRPATGSRT